MAMARSRRKFVKALLGGGAALLGGGAAAWVWLDRKVNPKTPPAYAFPETATAPPLPLTPACDDGDHHDVTEANIEGPFYTPDTPWRTNLREADTVGTPLVIEGRVLTPACVPIAGAVLDFWSCDGKGVYDNKGYRLRGHQFTDEEGRFRVETVKPSDYEQFMVHRTPHVHVKVQGRETALLTTQLYFPNEPLNEQDLAIKESLIMEVEEHADGTLLGRFDFVLA
jgi:protocatechuate 3,4-dioxygenase beta subunit